MKKRTLTILITVIITSLIFIPAAMADSCCASKNAMQIDHKSNVDGYELEYEFIDMKEKMKQMKDTMPEMAHQMKTMTATHHLMVFIKSPQGDTVTPDKVGFLIGGPDGKDQKVMAMCMSDGFGADINLSQPGEYTVKTKALLGEKKLTDAFTYTINKP